MTQEPVLDRSVRIEQDAVLILDRRDFPHRQEWVTARSAAEVAAAIRAMVTQSSGPTYAACAAFVLTARQVAAKAPQAARATLAGAGALLVAARPTNNSVRDAVDAVLTRLAELPADADTAQIVAAAEEAAHAEADGYRARSRALAEHAAALLPDGARLLTHCWMDTYLIELVRAAEAAGKQYTYVATETRPYLQGARLTAHTLAEMDQQVTLITDGMVAAVLSPHSTLGRIDAVVTAADRVSMDGHVFNKVGTLGAAVAARAFGVPYYALIQAPDPQAPTAADVVVEERDGDEVLYTLAERTASPLVTRGHYPAFDVTPPQFTTLIVTDRGPFEPASVARYHSPKQESR
jgi:methylthioribose-1-phosphate isomerase